MLCGKCFDDIWDSEVSWGRSVIWNSFNPDSPDPTYIDTFPFPKKIEGTRKRKFFKTRVKNILTITILGIVFIMVGVGVLNGFNTTSYALNNFKVRLSTVNVYRSNRNTIEIMFYLNITNYQAEHYGLGSLKYKIYGNSFYLCEREIRCFACGNTTLQSAFGQFADTISFNDSTINSELYKSIIDEQPIIWSASGELELYNKYKLTGINQIIKIPFDGLIYQMTDYS